MGLIDMSNRRTRLRPAFASLFDMKIPPVPRGAAYPLPLLSSGEASGCALLTRRESQRPRAFMPLTLVCALTPLLLRRFPRTEYKV